MTCEKCKMPPHFNPEWATLRILSKRAHRPDRELDFCSLDCLSRWVEAQRLIAPVEERP